MSRSIITILVTALLTSFCLYVVNGWWLGSKGLWFVGADKAPGRLALNAIESDLLAGESQDAEAKLADLQEQWSVFESQDWHRKQIEFCTLMGSALVAAVTLVCAVWFGRGQLQDIKVSRHTDALLRVLETWNSAEMYKAYTTMRQSTYDAATGYDTFQEDCIKDPEKLRCARMLSNFYNNMGFLAKKKHLDVLTLVEYFRGTLEVWNNMEPIIIGWRKADPTCGKEFEWLYGLYKEWSQHQKQNP